MAQRIGGVEDACGARELGPCNPLGIVTYLAVAVDCAGNHHGTAPAIIADLGNGARNGPEEGTVITGAMRNIGNALAGLVGQGPLDPDRQMHLEVLFGLLGHVAKLDSLITSHEAEFINELMDQMKLGIREREAAMTAVERGKSRSLDVAAEFARFSAVHPPGSREADQLFEAVIQLAAADERLRPTERQFLELAAEKLGYRDEEIDRRLATLKLR